jgi:hypothetical protein
MARPLGAMTALATATDRDRVQRGGEKEPQVPQAVKPLEPEAPDEGGIPRDSHGKNFSIIT